jgi:hypothetical protein
MNFYKTSKNNYLSINKLKKSYWKKIIIHNHIFIIYFNENIYFLKIIIYQRWIL